MGLGTGTQTGTGNSKTVHRPHANQNRLDPPDGDGPREKQGEPLLGVYQQLSGPERLKSGIRPASCQHVHVLCGQGQTAKFGPSQPLRRVATRARPQFETARETRYPSWSWRPPSFLPLPPSPLNPVPGPLSQSKTPTAPLQIRELERPCGRHEVATLEIGRAHGLMLLLLPWTRQAVTKQGGPASPASSSPASLMSHQHDGCHCW